ncbi:MAG: hypothetical protein RIC85_03080 [Gammaproteobacteria bacterium]
MSNKAPVMKLRDGLLEVAVWENTTNDGKSFHSFEHSRSYKDGEEWKKTTSLSGDDPLKVGLLYTQAYSKARELRQSQKQEQNQSQAPAPAHEPDMDAAKAKAQAQVKSEEQSQEQGQEQ